MFQRFTVRAVGMIFKGGFGIFEEWLGINNFRRMKTGVFKCR